MRNSNALILNNIVGESLIFEAAKAFYSFTFSILGVTTDIQGQNEFLIRFLPSLIIIKRGKSQLAF